jgi:DNA-directed RNA polymerase subunit K/omega
VIQNLPEGVDSKFRMVVLLARRAEQLMRGARPKAEIDAAKPTRMAAQEFSENLIRWDFGPEGGFLPSDDEEAAETELEHAE